MVEGTPIVLPDLRGITWTLDAEWVSRRLVQIRARTREFPGMIEFSRKIHPIVERANERWHDEHRHEADPQLPAWIMEAWGQLVAMRMDLTEWQVRLEYRLYHLVVDLVSGSYSIQPKSKRLLECEERERRRLPAP